MEDKNTLLTRIYNWEENLSVEADPLIKEKIAKKIELLKQQLKDNPDETGKQKAAEDTGRGKPDLPPERVRPAA
ncbi:MAG: hypothetical protein ACLFR2_12050 [Candidatus Kapaibacterium sp.]